jgi:hypothetical protein
MSSSDVRTNSIDGARSGRLSLLGWVWLWCLLGWQVGAAAEAVPDVGWGSRVLWYVPNRAMDLVDMFRLRVRLGPGWAVGVRATDYGSFYAGRYNAFYFGLPGPRYPEPVRAPWGRESLAGFVLAGVDATDDTWHGPAYGASEFNAGAQVGIVGVDAGFDPVELWDFAAGWFLVDPIGDDYPQRRREREPRMTSGVSIGAGEGIFAVEPKPAAFGAWSNRLDYLYRNVNRRISDPLRAADAYFALDPDDVIVPPQARVRMKFFAEVMQGSDFELRIEPDVELDVEFPNIQQRARLFIETARSDEVHDRTLHDTEERGLQIGARKWFESLNLSVDAGIKPRWLPQVFARMVWARDYELRGWQARPAQRLIANSDDRFATVSTLFLSRWLGPADEALWMNTSSAKWTLAEPRWTWSQSIGVGRVYRLLDETRRGRYVGWSDTVEALAVQYSVFGEQDYVETHVLGVGWRWPVYGQWVLGELRTGFEWDRGEDYKPAFFVRAGLDLLFWGTVRER